MGLTAPIDAIEVVGLGEDYRQATKRRNQATRERAALVGEHQRAQAEVLFPASESQDPARVQRIALEQQIEALRATENDAREDARRIVNEAVQRFAEKLAYDVRQAVLTRVEARRHPRLSWWYRV
ncbi:hypothetical protein GCM10022251_44310 [Phytohabitans flavus]|uniref:Uncharacterized protein n=2 Tax=Phytohabitans flavus TaxID=1076124 RepID=A0A6F8XYP5_9ACTN|nr:hypothetical protein Pflav_052580 [Phytohabitans flavus]